MDNEKYRSADWQENKLKELYYAFGTSEEEGLKLFLNLVFELQLFNPSFLEQVYHAIGEIKAEGIYDISETTLDWVDFWKSYDPKDEAKNPTQLEKLTALKDANCLSRENQGRLCFQLGLIEVQFKNFNSAIEYFKESSHLLPQWSWAYGNLGAAYSDSGNHTEAIAALNKAIELDPKDAKAYYNLGNVYGNLGRHDEALAAFHKAIELDPKYAKAYHNLGIAYDDLGRHDEALAAYHKAIELDPKDPSSHNSLGYLFLKEGQLDNAKAYLQKAIELDGKAYWAVINLGITYFQLKDSKNGQAQFSAALEQCPLDSVHGRLNQVTALLGLERSEEALQLLQQTRENFTIQSGEIKEFFTDWHLLANSPEPPAGIGEFLKRAEAILKT